ITGLIKANFPARIAYTVKSNMDSRVILDYSGAERLLGYGDMLFMSTEFKEPLRIQNSFLTTEEVETVCEHIAEQVGYSQPYMLPSTYQNNDLEASEFDFANRDELFEDAARFFIQQGTASTSILQRKFRIGYARAGKLVDELEAAGVIGPANGSKPRLVLFDSASDLERIL
ncbi:MAG: DNA translocase FtsK, partial [Candidatus Kapaibacteriota bacterium]